MLLWKNLCSNYLNFLKQLKTTKAAKRVFLKDLLGNKVKYLVTSIDFLRFTITIMIIDIWQSHKIYHGSHGKLESGNYRRKNLSRVENPERYQPGSCTFTMTLGKSNDDRLEKRKITSTVEYWKQATLNKRKWKKKCRRVL